MSILNKTETAKLLQKIKEKFQTGNLKITIPPPSFDDMNAEILEYKLNKSITVSFRVKTNQTNPMGFMQGGYIAAAFDNAFGPLSYLVAKKPTTTIDMNIQYIRSVANLQTVIVTAEIQARGNSTIHMIAEMKTDKGKLLATASTNLLILRLLSSNE
ncbi:MAG: PaaI family thioesterase [Leptospiraceae bacterium]|nr:PaaI family thioesterase [Leptospiraceae bacterium]